MPRGPRTAVTPETIVIGRQRPKIRIMVREEFSVGHAGAEGRHRNMPSIVVHDIPVDLVVKTIVEALNRLSAA